MLLCVCLCVCVYIKNNLTIINSRIAHILHTFLTGKKTKLNLDTVSESKGLKVQATRHAKYCISEIKLVMVLISVTRIS